MVQSGRNVITLVLDCCGCSQSSVLFSPLLSCLVCRLSVSCVERANKVWKKVQPCCLHFDPIQNTFILSHLLKFSNNPVKWARCGVFLGSGSFLSELLMVSPNAWGNPPQFHWLETCRDRFWCSSAHTDTFSSQQCVCSGAADHWPVGVFDCLPR